ncbi:MAG: hypothetical protein HY675_20175 [Chloroflexi bacterium]|nr:hypothetical protein [Chloroflexota bacterium]
MMKRLFLYLRLVVLVAALLFVLGLGYMHVFGTAAAEVPPRDDYFGVTWVSPPRTLADDRRFRQAEEIGARWDRFPFYWHEMQTIKDTNIDFGKMDAVVDADLKRGFQVQGILLGAPSWAIVNGKIMQDKWYEFVYQTVRRYKDRVRYWEVWNEPDLLDGNGQGAFWWGSIEDYYELLKTGYRAIRSADPNAKVLVAALAFPYNNQEFFPRFLEIIAKDSTAPSNNYYFDILPLHLYGRASTFFDLPLGYVGKPDFLGFHNMMRAKGFDKPIWINEAGVAVWDTGTGKNAPGRATMDEQASYVIQAFAYGLAAGVEKVFVFQLYDDGAGAIDPPSQQPAEYYGLISNTGVPRPAYTAYQVAAKYFGGAKLVTRVNFNRTGDPDVKGFDIITLYGTPNGKITTAWSNDGGKAVPIQIPGISGSATLVDKSGRQQTVAPTNGVYSVTLAPATNNNNFDCYTSRGCSPYDFIIGGNPIILVEPDVKVPPATVRPLPSGVRAPFPVSWGLTKPVTSTVAFDIQYVDPSEGVWRDWLVGTSAISGTFGVGAYGARLNHTYVFRARARDASGNLVDGYDYTPSGMASSVVLGGNVVTPTSQFSMISPTVSGVDVKIEIVWPHDNKPVTETAKVNIGSYMFHRDSLTSVNPSWSPLVRLWRAINNGVEEEVATGRKRTVAQGSLSFPVWEFNDVDVGLARDPLNKYYFRVAVDGVRSFSSVWSHGADARTVFPKMDIPSEVLSSSPTFVDAKVEIVWPKDGLPVDKADKANVGVYIFEHGTTRSVPLAFGNTVRLWRAQNNGPEKEVAIGQRISKTEQGITFPVWTFNDVDVAAARDPLNKYYFRVSVDAVRSVSNIWSHGVDARTHFPIKDTPATIAP